MRYLSQMSFEGDSPSDDDIDQLFSHLERFEPPANFVERVMAEVSRLPLPQFIPTSIVDSDRCTVRYRRHIPPAS
jgi:hypothetical protein